MHGVGGLDEDTLATIGEGSDGLGHGRPIGSRQIKGAVEIPSIVDRVPTDDGLVIENIKEYRRAIGGLEGIDKHVTVL